MSGELGTSPLLAIAGGPGLRINGEKVYLRPLGHADANDRYHAWLNDDELNRYSERRGTSYSHDDILAYLDDANTSPALLQQGVFMIEDNNHVGNISLRVTNVGARVAEVATLIGEKDYWGRGVIVDAGKALIHFAFQNLKLRKVTLGNYAINRASTFKSRQLGAKPEGRFRQAALIDGEYVDVLEFGLFAEEFYETFPDLTGRPASA
ncbi:MAG: GNAT family N-acetyltransferase [Rhodospirillaceae bacterium]|jgi:[ribosomal protein S5]-alanine N-acetyltransferase|nr:GNAT family N-acetyltransferase [Rhodospirillaceae bacterium]